MPALGLIHDSIDNASVPVSESSKALTATASVSHSATKAPATKPSGSSFSYMLSKLPKLERFVEADHLPDVLVVYDRGNLTNRGHRRNATTYRRFYPQRATSTTDPRRGVLHLDSSNVLATSRRSTVVRGALQATLGPRGDPGKCVTVAAKLANDSCRSHHLLHEEGKAYSAFPDEFFQNARPVPDDLVSLHRRHPPAMRSRIKSTPAWGVAGAMRYTYSDCSPEEAEPPIVPKFYGLYVPVDAAGKCQAQFHAECSAYANMDCSVPSWQRSILLMEDCGQQVDLDSMSMQQKKHCLELVQRMHRQGFSHGNAHPRNMLVQPGPLTVPPSERSMDSPSFRLISFGRWRGLRFLQDLETAVGARRAFEKGKETDLYRSMCELGLILSPASDATDITDDLEDAQDADDMDAVEELEYY